jgi:hypothetical protein
MSRADETARGGADEALLPGSAAAWPSGLGGAAWPSGLGGAAWPSGLAGKLTLRSIDRSPN